jgi:hypothetical protein
LRFATTASRRTRSAAVRSMVMPVRIAANSHGPRRAGIRRGLFRQVLSTSH